MQPQPFVSAVDRRGATDHEPDRVLAVAGQLRGQHFADQGEECGWVLPRLLGEIFTTADIAERPEGHLLQIGRQLVGHALWAACAWAITTTSSHLIPVD